MSIDTGVKFWFENQTDSGSDYSWINTGYVQVEYCTDKVRGFGGGVIEYVLDDDILKSRV